MSRVPVVTNINTRIDAYKGFPDLTVVHSAMENEPIATSGAKKTPANVKRIDCGSTLGQSVGGSRCIDICRAKPNAIKAVAINADLSETVTY